MNKHPSVATALVALVCAGTAHGQLTYASGQNVVAAFDGWERHADGSIGMVFSYYNRNYEESVDVPIGLENNIEPGGPDQGQPPHFLPARHKFVFSVTVPKGWDPRKRLACTLIVRGKTERANAFLLPEWEINSQVRAQNGDSVQSPAAGNAAEYNDAPEMTPGPRKISRCPLRQLSQLSSRTTAYRSRGLDARPPRCSRREPRAPRVVDRRRTQPPLSVVRTRQRAPAVLSYE